jgi:hypothetical protein
MSEQRLKEICTSEHTVGASEVNSNVEVELEARFEIINKRRALTNDESASRRRWCERFNNERLIQCLLGLIRPVNGEHARVDIALLGLLLGIDQL